MVSTPTTMTAEQLFHAGDTGRCELTRGRLVMMTPAGGEHGRIVVNLGFLLHAYVMERRAFTM